MSKGCTVALIIFVVLILIIAGAIALVVLNKDKILDKMVDSMQTQVIAHLPKGYTEDEVKSIMDDLKVALKNGQISSEKMQSMAEYMTTELDEERSIELLTMIQEAMGRAPLHEVEMLPDTVKAVPDSL